MKPIDWKRRLSRRRRRTRAAYDYRLAKRAGAIETIRRWLRAILWWLR